jgi:hypothetical protein
MGGGASSLVNEVADKAKSTADSVVNSLPDLPKIKIPEIPNIPDLPDLPDIPLLNGLPSIPNISDVSFDLPSIPRLPRIPYLPELPNPLSLWPPNLQWPPVPNVPDVGSSIKKVEHIKKVYDVLNSVSGSNNFKTIDKNVVSIITNSNGYVQQLGLLETNINLILQLDLSNSDVLLNLINGLKKLVNTIPEINENLQILSDKILNPRSEFAISAGTLTTKIKQIPSQIKDIGDKLNNSISTFSEISGKITTIEKNLSDISVLISKLDIGKIEQSVKTLGNINTIIPLFAVFSDKLKNIDLDLIKNNFEKTAGIFSNADLTNKFKNITNNITKISDFNENIIVLSENMKSIPENIIELKNSVPDLQNMFSKLTGFLSKLSELGQKLDLVKNFSKIQEFAPNLTNYMDVILTNAGDLGKFEFIDFNKVKELFNNLDTKLNQFVEVIPFDWANNVVSQLSGLKIDLDNIDFGSLTDNFEEKSDNIIKYLIIAGAIILLLPIILNFTLK